MASEKAEAEIPMDERVTRTLALLAQARRMFPWHPQFDRAMDDAARAMTDWAIGYRADVERSEREKAETP